MDLNLLYGVGLIAVMCLMVFIARPAKGQDSVPWLRVYIVGQVYLLTAMICGVVGITILIQSFP